MPNHLSTANLIYDDDVKLIVPRNRYEILKSYLHLSVSWPTGLKPIEGICPETILCEPTYFSPLIQIFYPASSWICYAGIPTRPIQQCRGCGKCVEARNDVHASTSACPVWSISPTALTNPIWPACHSLLGIVSESRQVTGGSVMILYQRSKSTLVFWNSQFSPFLLIPPAQGNADTHISTTNKTFGWDTLRIISKII